LLADHISRFSDPLVFTQLLQEIGVKGLQVDDLYSLDPETLESLQPIHALIFLFKWVDPTADETKDNKDNEAAKKVGGQLVSADESSDCGVYFAQQVINNACATIAAVNAVSSTSSKYLE
jgi:ubiquitin carboxyl-terminal hydrolase L5